MPGRDFTAFHQGEPRAGERNERTEVKLSTMLHGYLGRAATGALPVATGSRPELPANVSNWPEDQRDAYEERAGIMEVHGNVCRDEAERAAESDIRRMEKEETK